METIVIPSQELEDVMNTVPSNASHLNHTHTLSHTHTHISDRPSLPGVLHFHKSYFLASNSFPFTKLGTLSSTSVETSLEGPRPVTYVAQPPAVLIACSHLEVQLDSTLASILASHCKLCPFLLNVTHDTIHNDLQSSQKCKTQVT